MSELKTTRPYKERFLDGFDRSQLRQEVQKVKPRFNLRKKYLTWALGATLAVGGIGAPLKVIHDSQNRLEHRGPQGPQEPAPQQPQQVQQTQRQAPVDQSLAGDLRDAQNIANEVAGGVAAAAKGVEQGVKQAAEVPIAAVVAAPSAVAQAPQQIAQAAEDVKAQFFAKEVPFGSIIYQEAQKNNLRPELLAAIVQQESKFQPTARSIMGAQGLMQLVPKTGRWMGASNLMNPAQNIMAGAKYLKYLQDQFNGNETKVIAAYNAGEGNVRRFGGIPPFRETQKYVANVRNFQRQYSDRATSQVADLSR
ncbi:MAG TPA: lytic transglycosylase domain-containing protein [Thermoanaerobaculia bacterium]